MVKWHHRCNERELGQTMGDGEEQRSLSCCSPRGCKELDVTGQLNNNSRSYQSIKYHYVFNNELVGIF